MVHNATENDLNKVHSFKLKNGMVVELTKQDVIDNNLYKLTDRIPNLKIADTLSDNNPLKKIIAVLESGEQNKFLYYKILSGVFFICMFVVQSLAFYYKSSLALSMVFMTLWGMFLTVWLCKVQQLNKLSLLNILNNKLNLFIYSYFFHISFVVCLILFVYFSGDIQNINNVANWRYYIAYPIIVTIFVSCLSTLHNIDIVYKAHMIRVYLKHITNAVFVFSLVIMVGMLFLFSFPLKDMGESKIYIIIFLYSMCYISAVIFNNIMLLVFILIKTLSNPSK